jgi:4-hydroxy-2-oxoheptanedioate aldolase
MLRHGQGYTAMANNNVVALAMIETSAGLDALNEILAVDGLSGVFIGPSDLAFSLGFPPPNPGLPIEVASAIELIRVKAADAGKRSGIFCSSQGAGEAALRSGFDLVTTATDLTLVEAGTKASIENLRSRSLES